MTQRSAPVMSKIWPAVRDIRPQKIDPCWVIRSEAKVRPRTIPKNFARSPISIFIAIQDIAPPDASGPPSDDLGHGRRLARRVQRGRQPQGRQAERRDVPREVLEVERLIRLVADQPPRDRAGHLVMQALAD